MHCWPSILLLKGSTKGVSITAVPLTHDPLKHLSLQILLYQLVEEYYPAFEAQWAAEGRVLPDYVRQEFDGYLKCGRLEHGFLRVQCETCHAEHLVAQVLSEAMPPSSEVFHGL